MIIKVDVREGDLIQLLKKQMASSSSSKTKANPEKHTIQLSDEISIEVAIPTTIVKNALHITGPHTIVSERLPIGDIILCDAKTNEPQIIFERKSLYDLAASIKDGRYNEQSYRLDQLPQHNHTIVYLIEGDFASYNEQRGRMTKKTLNSALMSLFFYKGFSVIRTMSLHETSELIYDFADKYEKELPRRGFYHQSQSQSLETHSQSQSQSLETQSQSQSQSQSLETQSQSQSQSLETQSQSLETLEPTQEQTDTKIPSSDPADLKSKEKHYCEVMKIKKEKSENITPQNIGEIMLCNIPGISHKTAIAIMEKYTSLGNLFDELKKIAKPNDPKSISHCFADIKTDTSRKIGIATIEKIYNYLLYDMLG
jgi:ERCC4-type nuclease